MSLWVSIKRVSRYGLVGFFRNGFVSLSAVLIMTITLFVISLLMIAGAALNATLYEITQKVDVNVYFTTEASEDRILEVKEALEAQPEVASVTYVSREEALDNFRERHANDRLTIQALNELDENPLGASLAIQAYDTTQYEAIANFLETAPVVTQYEVPIIEKVNFFQNKSVIDRLSGIIDTSRQLAIAIAIVLGFSSLLIALNTIRLAIYTARDEIGVMRLVGAGRWYVRGPFLIAGVLYGVIAGLLVLIGLYPLTLWLGDPSERFFGAGVFNTFTYYTESFTLLFLTVMMVGIGLGVLSSYLAVRRYLKD